VAAEAINRCKRLAVVDGIRYQRLGDDEYYAQELFANEELTGYLRNMLDSQKSVYEQVVYDSQTEAAFASQLELNTAIKVYAKLPGWFTVPTPLGSLQPGLGSRGANGGRGPPLPRRGNKEQPLCRRPAPTAKGRK